MSTFSQWRKSYTSTGKPKQVTWICGPERILVDDVVQTIREGLGAPDWNVVSLTAGLDSERQIWSDIEHYSADSRSTKLVVVKSAERLKMWNRLDAWIKNRGANPLTYLVLVSDEEEIPRVEIPNAQKGAPQTRVADHIEMLTGKGHVIECKPYTNATAKYAVEWVQAKVPMTQGVAGYLLERADGNMRLVRDVCMKLKVFPDDITKTTIDAMLSESPRMTFVDALVEMDRRTAVLALQQVPVSDYSKLLGGLDERLDLLGLIHDLQSQGKNQGEITRAVGKRGFLVKDLLPYAKHYDRKRRSQIRQVLALADDALQSGSTVGVPEVIVTLW